MTQPSAGEVEAVQGMHRAITALETFCVVLEHEPYNQFVISAVKRMKEVLVAYEKDALLRSRLDA